MKVQLVYTQPRNDQPLARQMAKLTAKPNLADPQNASALALFDATVFSDVPTSDATHVTRTITLTLGARFLLQFTTDEAKKSVWRHFYQHQIDLLNVTRTVAAEPVLI